MTTPNSHTAHDDAPLSAAKTPKRPEGGESMPHSHWVIEAPAGKTVEWDSEITQDEPGRLIAGQSLEGASVRNSGRVEFLDSPDGRGTVVRVTLSYHPPAGTVGKLIARSFQKEPKVQARVDTVPDPKIVNPRDAIIKITSTAICGSDLHLYGHTIPTMKAGDVLGHEFMGEVVEIGRGNARLKVGQHRMSLEEAPAGYMMFKEKQNEVTKVVLKPQGVTRH